MLVAQLSDKASDPAAWSELAKTIGVGGLFGIVILILVSVAVLAVYRATIGANGFVRALAVDLRARFVAFLDRLEGSVDRLEVAAKQDRQSQEQMRDAGQQFASMGSAIADAVHADVRSQAAAIAATLRRSDT